MRAFGLGEIRRGTLPLRRADFLITWQVNGQLPSFDRRDGLTIALRAPAATLTFAAEPRDCAGTHFIGLQMQSGPREVPSSRRPRGNSAASHSWTDLLRWIPGLARATAMAAGGRRAADQSEAPAFAAARDRLSIRIQWSRCAVHFHTTPGDSLRNASRGEALEFETTLHGPTAIDRQYSFHIRRQPRQSLDARVRGGPRRIEGGTLGCRHRRVKSSFNGRRSAGRDFGRPPGSAPP